MTVPTNYRDARRAELRGLDDDTLGKRCRAAIEETFRYPGDSGAAHYREDCWAAALGTGRPSVFIEALDAIKQQRARERAANGGAG